MATQLDSLIAMSHEVGTDPSLVQGPGGNTSCKLGDPEVVLWVKASGTWLAQAPERPIFVPLRQALIMAAIDAGDDVLPPEAVLAGGAESLRPSIETTLHALMPHRYVVHTHAVNTIAMAVCVEARSAIAARLGGRRFAFVPYCRPGLPLALEVRRALADEGDVDVLILGNHGLVVGADSAQGALALTREVEALLRVAPRAVTKAPDAIALESYRHGDWRLPAAGVSHAVAHDAEALAIATAGSLYPDHVIFLGHAIAIACVDPPCDEVRAMVVPGAGVLVREACPPAADWMVHALSEVSTRLCREDTINYLTAEDEAALLDWDAEKYRQHLAKSRA